MISETINSVRRRTLHTPHHQQPRVISPQRVVVPQIQQRHSIHYAPAPNSLPHAKAHSPQRSIHGYPLHPQHSHVAPGRSPASSQIRNRLPSTKNVVQSVNNKTGVAQIRTESIEVVHQAVHRPTSDVQQNTIIDSIQTRQRGDSEIRHDPNIRIITSPFSNNFTNESKLLADQFKSTLEKVEQLKSECIQQQNPNPSKLAAAKQESTLNQYIVQLLTEASRTKNIISKLIDDNSTLIAENNRLLKLEQEYDLVRKALIPLQLQNTDLKEELRIVLRENQENRQSNDNSPSDQEHQALIINALQQEIQSLKSAIDNSNNPEEFTKIIHSKNQEIQHLVFQNENIKGQNQDLSLKIKELLAELYRFGNERVVLMEESQGFRVAATQEIDRLRSLLDARESNQTPSPLPIIPEIIQKTEGRTFPQYNDSDTRITISGGYQELVLGKTPSPARIVSNPRTQINQGHVPVFECVQSS